jgi:hypothetical protein
MKTHTLTIKTRSVKNTTTTKSLSFRERIEGWFIRKMLGRVKD